MKIDTDELKNQTKKRIIDLVNFTQKQAENFQEQQWPTIKNKLENGAKKINEVTKGKSKVIFENSKKAFKDSVRALDQKVNGSSIHRDNNGDKQ